MSERISPPASATQDSHCSPEEYDALYRQSIEQPDAFWAEQAKRIDWFSPPTRIGNWSFDPVDIQVLSEDGRDDQPADGDQYREEQEDNDHDDGAGHERRRYRTSSWRKHPTR